MKKLRVGMIRCGGIADQEHFPALEFQSDLCEMAAFCDKTSHGQLTWLADRGTDIRRRDGRIF